MSVNQSAGVIRGPIPIKNVEPYYKIALKTALKSPCTRRQYGAVIAYDDLTGFVTGFNARVTHCCDDVCIRERYGITHASRTELGAEVHAEQAALIEAPKKGVIFVLAGYKHDKELTGVNVYPCLVCARMIKYAGYNWVYMKNEDDEICPVSIYDIIERREAEAGPVYD